MGLDDSLAWFYMNQHYTFFNCLSEAKINLRLNTTATFPHMQAFHSTYRYERL